MLLAWGAVNCGIEAHQREPSTGLQGADGLDLKSSFYRCFWVSGVLLN